MGSSAPIQTVTAAFDTGGTVGTVQVVTGGIANLDFTDAGGGTCAPGATYTAGQSCTVVVKFQPQAPGRRAGAIVVSDLSHKALATTYLYGTALGSVGVFVPGEITTVAGSDRFLFSGDTGPATLAGLQFPTGVTADPAGNVFLADSSHNRVRRVDAKTGIITTVAGNGTANYAGDGNIATASELNNPAGVALDGAGNLYIADNGNNVVRMVSASNSVISTLAGTGAAGYTGDSGPALSATLNAPTGLALDDRGGLYIADMGNNAVRKVDLIGGTIATYAGNGTAGYSGNGGPASLGQLNSPQAVAWASSGVLYVADAGNNRIRAVDAGGIITKYVGNGLTNFIGDGGDAGNAEVYSPSGVAVDAAGNLYVSDTGHNRIRKVSATTHIITTVAGDPNVSPLNDGMPATNGALYAPYSIALDSMGSLYIADSFHNRIRKVSANAALITYPASTPPTQVGQQSAVTVQTLENDGSASLVISAVTAQQNAAVDAPTTTCAAGNSIAVEATCAVGVRAAPAVAGTPVTGSVDVSSDASNSPGVISIAVNAVVATSTTTSLASSLNPSGVGQNVTFTATVAGTSAPAAVPTGTVTFRLSTVVLKTVPLDGTGAAAYSTSGLAVGSHAITATYNGDPTNLSSVSPVLTQIVVPPTVIALTSTPNPSRIGVPVTFKATVSGSNGTVPTGKVSFTDGGVLIGSATLDANGVASFTTSALTAGNHAIQAAYSGDANTAPGTSSTLIQTVESTATTTHLIASATALSVGQPLTLTALVTNSQGAAPTGTVTFTSGGAVVGTAPLDAASTGSITITPPAGTDKYTASYSGDALNSGSASQSVTVVVTAPPDFSLTVKPATITIPSGNNSLLSVTLTSTQGFTDKVDFGCTAVPALANCVFSPSSITLPANGTATVQLTFNAFPLNLSSLSAEGQGRPGSPLRLALALPGAILLGGFAAFFRKGKRALRSAALVLIAVAAFAALNGCGGSTVNGTAPGTYKVLIEGVGETSGQSRTVPLTVVVTK